MSFRRTTISHNHLYLVSVPKRSKISYAGDKCYGRQYLVKVNSEMNPSCHTSQSLRPIGVRDGGGGAAAPPIRAVCRHEFGQTVDIIRAKHNTCLKNTNLGSVTGVNGKKTRI